MKIEPQHSDEAILEELGIRLARRRVDLGFTQAELAEQAGVSKRTVERIEAGHTAQMKTMIRILRTLDLIGGLEQLAGGQVGPRPMDLLKRTGTTRKRASSRRRKEPGKGWTWGDQS